MPCFLITDPRYSFCIGKNYIGETEKQTPVGDYRAFFRRHSGFGAHEATQPAQSGESKNRFFMNNGKALRVRPVHVSAVINSYTYQQEVSMPDAASKKRVAVSLESTAAERHSKQRVPLAGAVKFDWELSADVRPLEGGQSGWRVSLCFTAGSKPPQVFYSTETDVEIGETGTVSFVVNPPPLPPEEFGVDRFETVLHPTKPETLANNGPQVQLRFRLMSDTTEPTALVIERTDLAVFWIIGARSIILTDR